MGVNSKVCEDEKPWWLLALAQPSTSASAVNQTPQTYTQDSTITINAGQSVSYNPSSHVEGSKYTVSPTLPAGLVLDANTGVISGTPTTAITSTKYIVTQTKPDSTTATIAFTIVVNSSSTGTSTSTGTTTSTYTIGGNITGLTAAGLVLQNNTADDLTVSSGATTFSFATKVTGAYAVTVKTQPTGLTCTVSSGSGTASANVTGISVACVANTYTIGGTVTGLTAAGLVLQNNTADDLTVSSGATTFSFATKVTGAYTVTVKTQPTGLTCTVSSGSGTATANVTGVSVACVANTYTIGGTVTGLTAAGLVLQNNTADDLTVSSGATTFSFATKVTGAYTVTVKTQPTGLTCTVSSGSGTASANVTNISVTCIPLWTKQLGVATKNTYGYGVAIDSSGNVYVTGYTDGGLDGNAKTGTQDAFVIKYDASGTKQWTKLMGVASQSTNGNGIALDSSGNVYITGSTTGGLDGNTVTGSYDVFVIKYNSSGTKQWTKQLGVASQATVGMSVALDLNGNIYLAGYTAGGLDGNTLTGSEDVFIIKYNSSGTKQWTKQLGVASSDTEGYGVATDSSGNVYVTGFTFGGLDGNTKTGTFDTFVIKYDGSGSKQWTKQLGVASQATQGQGVALDSSGNIYLAGYTDGGLDGNTKTGLNDVFVTNKLR